MGVFETVQQQVDYGCSIIRYAAVRACCTLTVMKKDQYKTPSVSSLDTKVYLLLPFYT